MLVDDIVDHGQAEAGALALLLGGEEGVEDPGRGLGLHAHPGVAHRDPPVVAVGCLGVFFDKRRVRRDLVDGHGQGAAPGGILPHDGHGVYRVDAEVQQDLLHLGGVGKHIGRLRCRMLLHLHGFVKGVLPDLADMLEGEVEVHGHKIGMLPAGQGEQLAYHVDGPLSCGFHAAEILAHLRQRQSLGGADLVLEQGEVAHDAGQHVVEIMGQAPGQGADGFHLLGLPQLLFLVLQLGDVVEADGHPGGAVGNQGEKGQVVEMFGMRQDLFAMDGHRAPAAVGLLDLPDIIDSLADRLLGGDAGEPAGGGIPLGHRGIGVQGDQHGGHGFDDIIEVVADPDNLPLRGLAGSDVVDQPLVFAHLPVRP